MEEGEKKLFTDPVTGEQVSKKELKKREKILEAVGFEAVYESRNREELVNNLKEIRDKAKSAMIVYTRQGSRADLGRPTTTPEENKEAIMKKLQK